MGGICRGYLIQVGPVDVVQRLLGAWDNGKWWLAWTTYVAPCSSLIESSSLDCGGQVDHSYHLKGESVGLNNLQMAGLSKFSCRRVNLRCNRSLVGHQDNAIALGFNHLRLWSLMDHRTCTNTLRISYRRRWSRVDRVSYADARGFCMGIVGGDVLSISILRCLKAFRFGGCLSCMIHDTLFPDGSLNKSGFFWLYDQIPTNGAFAWTRLICGRKKRWKNWEEWKKSSLTDSCNDHIGSSLIHK